MLFIIGGFYGESISCFLRFFFRFIMFIISDSDFFWVVLLRLWFFFDYNIGNVNILRSGVKIIKDIYYFLIFVEY